MGFSPYRRQSGVRRVPARLQYSVRARYSSGRVAELPGFCGCLRNYSMHRTQHSRGFIQHPSPSRRCALPILAEKPAVPPPVRTARGTIGRLPDCISTCWAWGDHAAKLHDSNAPGRPSGHGHEWRICSTSLRRGSQRSGSRGSSKPGDLMRSATDWVPW